jgi:hypothetical protein
MIGVAEGINVDHWQQLHLLLFGHRHRTLLIPFFGQAQLTDLLPERVGHMPLLIFGNLEEVVFSRLLV